MVGGHFKILFPTEEHVEDSYLGVEGANSVILRAQYWDDEKFPKQCFHRQDAVDERFEGNLYHAKWMVVTDEAVGDLNGGNKTQ